MGAEAWAGAVTLMYTVMSICIRRNWATMRLGGTWTWTLLNNRILDKCVHPVTCNVTWNENKTWQCNQYGVVLIVIDQSILRIYKIIVLHINRKKNSRAQKLTMKDIIFAKSKPFCSALVTIFTRYIADRTPMGCFEFKFKFKFIPRLCHPING